MRESVLERLTGVHPNLEIWWDSSPLVFKSWLQKMLDHAPAGRRAALEEQLSRIYVIGAPASSLVRGCTTNPPLSLAAVKSDPKFWNEWIDDLIASNPGLGQHDYFSSGTLLESRQRHGQVVVFSEAWRNRGVLPTLGTTELFQSKGFGKSLLSEGLLG